MDLLILSQDEETLIKAKMVSINEYNTMPEIIGHANGERTNIGRYKTEERAKEVLKEILKKQDDIDEAYFLGMTETRFESRIYKMPKE